MASISLPTHMVIENACKALHVCTDLTCLQGWGTSTSSLLYYKFGLERHHWPKTFVSSTKTGQGGRWTFTHVRPRYVLIYSNQEKDLGATHKYCTVQHGFVVYASCINGIQNMLQVLVSSFQSLCPAVCKEHDPSSDPFNQHGRKGQDSILVSKLALWQ